jgi:D-sedoheptulose 7-phosphate isomerase
MLTLALTGPVDATPADFHFAVPSDDPCVVQEVHEMLYHVLWELVHVFFERRGVGA